MKHLKLSQIHLPTLHRETCDRHVSSFIKAITMGLVLSAVIYTGRVMAEPSGDLMVDLMNRMGTIEDENRNLYGKIEELQHELKIVTQKMETLAADVEFRLGDSKEPGGPQAPTPLGATEGVNQEKVAQKLTPEEAAPVAGPEKPGFEAPVPVPSRGEHVEAEAALSGKAATPNDQYEKARSLLEQGDYTAAEHAFASFLKANPKDKQASAAQYWLGVTFFVRGDHEKAASEFAKGYKAYPKSKKAPETLLKLAKSLENLNRKADACATLDQLTSQFPKAHVKEVSSQRKSLKCKG